MTPTIEYDEDKPFTISNETGRKIYYGFCQGNAETCLHISLKKEGHATISIKKGGYAFLGKPRESEILKLIREPKPAERKEKEATK